ncbi:MAG: TolC family protein [Candidatus Gastranaerophilaceae bacterium]|jgi:glr3618 protein
MKRLLFTLALLFCTLASVQAAVVNVDLEKMIEIGLKENCDLKIKRMELKAAEKDIKIANRLKNPEIQSNVVIGNVALGNSSQAGVALPIEVLKRGVRKKIAQEEYSIKETELRQAEHNYKLQIMQAYFDILYAKSVYNIQEERLKLFKNLVKITTDKPKYPAYEIDNLKADIQYAQQLIEVNRAKAALLAKQFEMNKILNTGKDDVMYDTKEPSLLGHWAFMEIKIPEYEFLENVALQYSYVVKISEKNIDKAEQELTYAKRQRVPDVSVAGGYAWQAHRNAPNDYGGAFVGFNMDLPVLYNFTPEIQKAQIFLERSKAGKKAYEHQLKYELKKDFNTFKYSAENMEYSKKILQDSEKIVKLSTDGYISGKNSYTDLVINENGHQEVLSQYLNAMSRHFYSYLELMQDIGHDILIEEDLL